MADSLPQGKVCGDCAHFKRCAWLLSREPTETECDWSPSRFRARPEAPPPPAPPVYRSGTVKVNAAPLVRQLWGLEPLRRPGGGRD